jgi:hypothetical protein
VDIYSADFGRLRLTDELWFGIQVKSEARRTSCEWIAAPGDYNSVGSQGILDYRAPKIFDLLADPFERGDGSLEYDYWMMHRAFLIVPAQAAVAQWLESFKDFPVRQKPASFNLDAVMQNLSKPAQGND